ncbi:MAG: phosphatidate cytidylyltransferase [Peptococcaceae bacterium]|nr:phosphatidate cytidylyltransferase [Peptococcaceae bacterium]
MVKRVLSALIGIPILLLLTWHGGWYLASLIVVLALLGLREFLNLGQKAGFNIRPKLTALFCILWLVIFLLQRTEWFLPLAVIWFVISFGNYGLNYPTVSFTDAAYSFLSIFYPVGLFTILFFLRDLPDGKAWCFFVFILVWITDSGAYFIGSAFGESKLAPKVSPNKSIEGAIGGLVAACCFGLIFWYLTRLGNLYAVLLLSLLASIVSQVGDLFESALKRTASLKDSGAIIPGHGGILDRFDSLLFAIPIVYVFLLLGMAG